MIAPYTVIRIPESGKFWNLGSWAVESGIQLMESGIPLHNDLSPESNIKCSDKQSVIEYLEDEIHIVEFRIEESIGLLYMRST